jgi:hypothetical protein
MVLGVALLPPHVHTGLLAPLCLAGLLLAISISGARLLSSPRAGTAAAMLAASFLVVMSAANAHQALRSMRLLAIWLVGGVLFVAVRQQREERRAASVVPALAIAASLLAVLGLYQTLVSFPGAAGAGLEAPPGASEDAARFAEAVNIRLRSGRAVGTMGLPALLASILVMGIPLTVALAVAGGGWSRLAWSLLAIVETAGLIATRSVGGAAALLLAVSICAPFWAGPGARRRWGVLAIVVVVVAFVGAPRVAGVGEGSAASSLRERAANWEVALSMLISDPILGVGPDNYGIAFPGHRSWASNETQHAHNTFLEIVSDLGLPAVPFLIAGIVALARWAAAASRSRPGDAARARWRDRALAIACVAWAAQNLVDFGAYVAASMIPFMAVAGLLARQASRLRAAEDERSPPAGLPTRALLLIVTSLVALAAIPDAVSRRHLDVAVERAAGRDLEGAAGAARLAVTWNPLDPEARTMLALSLVGQAVEIPVGAPGRAGIIEEARAAAEEAVRLDPVTANRRAALARVRIADADLAGGYAAMSTAARLNPFKSRYADDRDELRSHLLGPEGDRAGQGSPGR